MSHFTTLGEFIIDRQKDFPGSSGELSRILSAIRLASKIVNQEINKAGVATDILGAAGSENIQGEQQQKLDVYADEKFIKAIEARGVVCGIGLVCVVYQYIRMKCIENRCFDCNRYGLLPTINPQSTIKTTAHRAGV